MNFDLVILTNLHQSSFLYVETLNDTQMIIRSSNVLTNIASAYRFIHLPKLIIQINFLN